MTSYAKHVSTKSTPQNKPIPGKKMVENSAGGFVFAVDCWARLERFLILGNEGGSYYASEQKLTEENAKAVRECFNADPDRTIKTIVDISVEGRATKNDPAIFALAMLSKDSRALEAMHKVCRTGTHLFQFIDDCQHFRGRGRAFQRCIQNWYLSRDPRALSYQLVKYQQRNGWSHRDVLRLCKPKTDNAAHDACFQWATGKGTSKLYDVAGEIAPIYAFEQAKKASTAKEIVALIERYDLVRECIPTQFLNDPGVWDALLQKMPLMAMVRNLGKMSNVGLLKPMSKACGLVCEKLNDAENVKRSRIHPVSLLMASSVYRAGCGMRGNLRWTVDSAIQAALEDAFYLAFNNVESSGQRYMLALDVSGSMGATINNTFLTCREAAAAMSMVTVRNEPMTHAVGFTSGGNRAAWNRSKLAQLPFTKNTSLTDAAKVTSGLPFGGTDCSLPMQYALVNKIEADVFVVYTDNETWHGKIHPVQALQTYRDKMGIPAKLIVAGMTANWFSIADPNDTGMIDIVGFDTAAPSVISSF